ncbi:O-antigen ligase family protein [Alkalihalobacillus sp. R86527]|uniref:O-antigen ligase family protein n=1 Tax=Alkalihalobacillus sp. R86527 TaxID=3093863 RepID=UPI00366BFC17
MILNINKIKFWILLNSLNIYLVLYVAKVYQLPFANDNIRLITTIILCTFAFFGIFEMVFIKQELSKVYSVFLGYFIFIFCMNIYLGQFNLTDLMTSLFFPIIFLSSYAIFKKNRSIDIIGEIKKNQFIMLLVYFILYSFVRLVANVDYGMVTNSIYYQVLLFPFLLLIRKSSIRNIGIMLVITSILFSMKRAAFIAIVVALLVYLITQNSSSIKKQFSKTRKAITLAVLMIIIYIVNIFISLFNDTNIFNRFESITDDGGSGRLEILSIMIYQIKTSGFYDVIFGHGVFTSSEVTGGFASHNDFVEMLWSYGIGGLFIYLFIYGYLIHLAIKFIRNKYRYSAVFNASISLFFVLSLFSQLIFIPTYIGYLCLFWSFIISDYEKGFNKEEVI